MHIGLKKDNMGEFLSRVRNSHLFERPNREAISIQVT